MSDGFAKQGTSDGLCGIYNLANYITYVGKKRSRYFGKPQDLVRYFLEAADRLGLFSVARVTCGFEAHEIADIFGEFCRSHRLAFKAALFSQEARLRDSLASLFEQSALIVPIERGRHWVLAVDYLENEQSLTVIDPCPDYPVSNIGLDKIFGQWKDGVVLTQTTIKQGSN